MLKIPKIEDKNVEGRSKKSQEKVADQYMTISTTIANAVFVAVFVYPFVELIKSTTHPEINPISLSYVLSLIKKVNLPLFCIVYFLPLYISNSLRKQALKNH